MKEISEQSDLGRPKWLEAQGETQEPMEKGEHSSRVGILRDKDDVSGSEGLLLPEMEASLEGWPVVSAAASKTK